MVGGEAGLRGKPTDRSVFAPFYLAAWEFSLYQGRIIKHAVNLGITHSHRMRQGRLYGYAQQGPRSGFYLGSSLDGLVYFMCTVIKIKHLWICCILVKGQVGVG
jgi:hypothetical protein